jgi:hypothetical protein
MAIINVIKYKETTFIITYIFTTFLHFSTIEIFVSGSKLVE